MPNDDLPAPAKWRTRAFAELATRLDGVLGGKTAKQFAALKVATVGDLMRHVPRRYVTGTEDTVLGELRVGEEVAVVAPVISSKVIPGGRRSRLQVQVGHGGERLALTFFGAQHLCDWWAGQLPHGARGIFFGKVGAFQDQLQLTNPDFVTLDERGRIVGGAKRNRTMGEVSQRSGLIGLYPASKALPTWEIARCADLVLDHLGPLEEPWPAWVLAEGDVPGLADALEAVHRPLTVEGAERGIFRLQFDEALTVQLAMAKRRSLSQERPAVPRPRRAGGLLDAFDARLPFELTRGQREVGEEIFAELERPRPMQRLLQGEVGSGKTLVALRAMLAAVDAGAQVALLAPTEVLATQHHRSITAMLGDLAEGGTLGAPEHATRVVLHTGSAPAAVKRQTLLEIASGEAGIVIGTHALLSPNVTFAELGLVVVDEQHRFGVEQRAALFAKAETRPHLLVMTATPIPRTVAMTVFGDLETSVLREIPAGRSDVATTVVAEDEHPGWVARVWQRALEEVAQGRQVFVVCPRITAEDARGEDGEGGDIAGTRSVEELYTELAEGPLASVRVAKVHGALPADEKDDVMRRFGAGEIDVLVATTVIEVGIDVPNASMMVISDADRFGVSQLHQLRGRIGRGRHPGVCLLLTHAAPDAPARERLDAVAALRDGFALAEIDLAQRREGDVLGAAQAGGRSGLRLLRATEHSDLIQLARTIAERALADDPELNAEPGFADAVTQIEDLAAGAWLERT